MIRRLGVLAALALLALGACTPARSMGHPPPVTGPVTRPAPRPERPEPALQIQHTYPPFETSFHLPRVTGNPFEVEVWAEIETPSGARFMRPAFYDGNGLWRLRVTPVEPGRHRFRLLVGPEGHRVAARATDLAATDFDAAGVAEAGFVRRSAARVQAFAFDDGTPFYPLGHNVAWATPDEYERIFGKMGDAGENWSRVWMAHWSGQNLDWNPRHPVEIGTLDLDVARAWDRIIRAAERHHIRLQFVLQHHGQYSTTTNPNWSDNPWASANGGFLERPEDFFTSPRARALTEMKYRYVVARWGYSTAIMAWELFNEVQWTDAYKAARIDEIAAWHREMAAYLRSIDAYRHLVTTSSMSPDSPIYADLDYFQPHRYAVDLLDAVRRYSVPTAELDRPIFYGEMGPEAALPGLAADARTVHAALWAGIMADGAGAAQYWFWRPVDAGNLYPSFGSAARFAARAEFAARRMRSWPAATRGPTVDHLVLSPTSDWTKNDRTRFELHDDGRPVDGIDRVPVTLHGTRDEKAGVAHNVEFRLTTREPVRFRVHLDEISSAKAGVEIRVDGAVSASKAWPAAARDRRVDAVLSATVAPRSHSVRVTATGAGWIHVTTYELDGYPQQVLRALARVAEQRDRLALWVYSEAALGDRKAPAVHGQVVVGGLAPGRYSVDWWDPERGERTSNTETTIGPNGVLTLATPSIDVDAAAIVARSR